MWEMVKGISKVPVQRRWALSGDSDGEYRNLNRRVRLLDRKGLVGPVEGDFVLWCGKP